MKAAFIYNFARFIRWPEHSYPVDGGTFDFCIVGDNPFDTILSNIENKTIEGRPIKIHYFGSLTTDQQCHLAFFAENKAQSVIRFSDELAVNATVTVSDVPGFVQTGGDIEFTHTDNRIQFIINNTGLKHKGLWPSSSLLELAETIY